MDKDILGLRHCANVLGIGVDRIRRLIFIKKIKPKMANYGRVTFYKFTPHDQDIIRQSTSRHD